MAEKSFFFNSFEDETLITEENPKGYDRPVNADDISDWFRFCFTNGVIKTNSKNNEPQGLKVVAGGGLSVKVQSGFAVINGKPYMNTTDKALTFEAATSTPRYDMIVLRFNNVQNMATSSRKITAEYKKGTSSVPTVDSLTRSNTIYEILLAYVYVGANASEVGTIYDTRGDKDLCGWFTAVKGYEDYYDAIIQHYERVVTLSTSSTNVITDLSSKLYNDKYSLIEVFTNGIKEPKTAYTIGLSGGYINIAFTSQKAAGAKIAVNLDNFIDGEGMSTALAQYTQLLADVSNLKAAGDYDYICNGVNDNELISNVVKAYLQGGTDYGTMKLNVIGNIGMSYPVYGGGSSSNPYGWFDFGTTSNTRKAIVDFSRCGQISPLIENGTANNIFAAKDIHVIGANIAVNNTATNTIIRIVGTTSGVVKFENCRFYITAYQDSVIAYRGTFINCRGSVANTINNSYCFLPASNSVVKLFGGEYYAYTGDSAKKSAIVGQSGAEAVSILYGVSAPTSAMSGFYQTNSILQFAGGGIVNCTDLISELPIVVVSGSSRGTIAKSKTNVW